MRVKTQIGDHGSHDPTALGIRGETMTTLGVGEVKLVIQ